MNHTDSLQDIQYTTTYIVLSNPTSSVSMLIQNVKKRQCDRTLCHSLRLETEACSHFTSKNEWTGHCGSESASDCETVYALIELL